MVLVAREYRGETASSGMRRRVYVGIKYSSDCFCLDQDYCHDLVRDAAFDGQLIFLCAIRMFPRMFKYLTTLYCS